MMCFAGTVFEFIPTRNAKPREKHGRAAASNCGERKGSQPDRSEIRRGKGEPTDYTRSGLQAKKGIWLKGD